MIGEYSKINNSACYHFSKLSILYKRLNEKNQGVVSCALNMFENYKTYTDGAKRQAYKSKNEFSWDKMKDKLDQLFTQYIPEFPKAIELKLPQLKKIELPKLKKVEENVAG